MLAPTQKALAQPSTGTNVPAARTGYAVPIPHRAHLDPAQGQAGRVNRPLLSPDPVALNRAKKLANDRAAASQHAPGVAAPVTRPYSVYNGTNFAGLNATGCCTPSDSTGAIGPNNYVEMVNSTIQVRDRSGSIQATTGLTSFAFANTDCVFDPQISWDAQAGHWLYSFLDQVPVSPGTPGACGNISANWIMFGWSITSDPSNFMSWCPFALGTGTDLVDYDKLGHDNNFINIGGNDFSNSGIGPSAAFQTANIVSIRKPTNWSACGGTFPAFTVFGSPQAPLRNPDGLTNAWTPVPADTADSSGVGYIVAAHNPIFEISGIGTKVGVWHVSLSRGSASLTTDGDVTVIGYTPPPAVPQPGTTSCSTSGTCLDSLDARLTQAVAHYDPNAGKETIWTQHAVTDQSGTAGLLSVERWYELIPGQTGPRQQGNIFDSTLYIFNGAVSPTTAGNEAVIFYNAGNGSAGNYASFRAQSRNSSTALNAFTNETILASSTVNDNDFSCGVNNAATFPCRWGDYSAARPDPMNSNAVWGTIMLTGTGGTNASAGWATQVAAYTPGCSTVAVTPASPTFVDGSINLITATASGCTNPEYAFYVQYPAGTGTWTLKQAFSPTNTWNWDSSGYAAGSYLIHVWANQIGDSTANLEAVGSDTVTLTADPACTSAGVTPPSSVQPTGPTINFTTTVSTCTIPVFAYYIQDPTGTWTLKRAFSTDPTYAWNTTGLAPGHYNIHVWVNARGHSTSTFEALGSATADLNICTGAGLTGPTNPLVGTVVTMTASSTGCVTPQYQFYVIYPNQTRHLGKPWGTATTFDWNTGGLAPGTYTVQVWANNVGDPTTNAEAMASTPVTLIGCTTANASPDKVSPQIVGTTIVFTASSGPPSGCQNPLYQWFLKDPTGKWTLEQSWNMSPTWSWPTTGFAPGLYTIHVWANQANSDLSTYEAVGGPNFTLQASPPCANVAVTPTNPSTPAGSPIDFTATSTGCPSPEYALYAQYPDTTWHLVRGFGTSTAIHWDTSGLAPGSYLMHLWASATGSGHDSIGADTVTLTGCGPGSAVTAPGSAPAGTVVNMTGNGDAGCPNPVFEYWVQYPDMSWHFGRTWGASAWGWDTSNPALKPGTYHIHAWTNQSGASQATYEAIGAAQVILTGCTMPTTVTQSSTTSSIGTPVTFTVTATTGCTTPIYEFWLQYPDMSWHEGQPFSTTNTWTWTPTAGLTKGTYVLHVWVNNQGADTSTYETIGSANHTLN